MAGLAAVSPSSSTARAMTPAAFLARTIGRVAQVVKAWRNRREFYRLGEMTDAELADIGLTRADLSVVVGLPLSVDPTAQLGVIANARIRSIEEGVRLIA